METKATAYVAPWTAIPVYYYWISYDSFLNQLVSQCTCTQSAYYLLRGDNKQKEDGWWGRQREAALMVWYLLCVSHFGRSDGRLGFLLACPIILGPPHLGTDQAEPM